MFWVCLCTVWEHVTGCEQVKSGAWTGNAFIQYDVSEVRSLTALPSSSSPHSPPPPLSNCPSLKISLQGGSYEGCVMDGKPHGRGRLTDTLGVVTEGIWIHGKLDANSK